jgi:hypothetical protein
MGLTWVTLSPTRKRSEKSTKEREALFGAAVERKKKVRKAMDPK